MLLVLGNKGKGMQSSSEQPLVGQERYVTTLITAAKETNPYIEYCSLEDCCNLVKNFIACRCHTDGLRISRRKKEGGMDLGHHKFYDLGTK